MKHSSVSPSTAEKEIRLRTVLRDCGSTLVAYSGGVDSAYLAWVAAHTPGIEMLALIADSPSLPRTQLQFALDFAQRHDIPCEVIQTQEMENPDYRRNDQNRCFFCKDELFGRMEEETARRGRFCTLAYGVNADDKLDFRPGHRAAARHGVRAPLLEAGLTKQDIRTLAHEAGLEVWDRPAAACLSSRIAYGIAVTPEVLRIIEEGEEAVRALGFHQFRVRYHKEIVRLEIAREDLPRALDLAMADRLTGIFKKLGFRYVTLDLEGFRSGAMNEVLISAHSLAGR